MQKLGLLLFLVVTSVGCTQALQTHHLQDVDSIPKETYFIYSFTGGPGDRWKAVLLKAPGAGPEIIPYSSQIRESAGSFSEALAFMREGGTVRKVEILVVSYMGKTIGYLLTYSPEMLVKDLFTVNMFERAGKIYFSVNEEIESD